MAAELAEVLAAGLAEPWPAGQPLSGSGGHEVFSRTARVVLNETFAYSALENNGTKSTGTL